MVSPPECQAVLATFPHHSAVIVTFGRAPEAEPAFSHSASLPFAWRRLASRFHVYDVLEGLLNIFAAPVIACCVVVFLVVVLHLFSEMLNLGGLSMVAGALVLAAGWKVFVKYARVGARFIVGTARCAWRMPPPQDAPYQVAAFFSAEMLPCLPRPDVRNIWRLLAPTLSPSAVDKILDLLKKYSMLATRALEDQLVEHVATRLLGHGASDAEGLLPSTREVACLATDTESESADVECQVAMVLRATLAQGTDNDQERAVVKEYWVTLCIPVVRVRRIWYLAIDGTYFISDPPAIREAMSH